MSQSQFDPVVTKSAEGYQVGGQLGRGSAPRIRLDGRRDVRISVMVWQTAQDQDAGEEGNTPVAIASGTGGQAEDAKRWTATITMHQKDTLKESLTPGRPATGIAVSVECADVQTAFETFTWADRVQIPIQPSGGTVT
jgi:hypothetical protein